jgi:pimeloyl-ACP methyl ester carboxylesterase
MAMQSLRVRTDRLDTYLRTGGDEHADLLLLVHGNASSSVFFDELIAVMSASLRVVAPDLRGYGESEPRQIDARRGMRDFSDDLWSLVVTLGYGDHRKVNLLGWSMGAGVAMQFAIDHPQTVRSLVLESPLSPYGFGGTKDAVGTPCWADRAGSGGGAANAEYVQRLAAGDRSAESPFSPRNVMNSFYFKPPFRVAPEREEELVSAVLAMRVGEGFYPGGLRPSPNWPGVAPGEDGVNNAMAPGYCDLSPFAGIAPRPPVLWVRGADDQIVSDLSLLDFGTLGQLGAVPGWPGAQAFPPQPMVSQMRSVLERYAAAGGQFEELVVEGSGHSPHLERPEIFTHALRRFLRASG